MDLALLDTDILSEVLKGKDASVLLTAGRYLQTHSRFAFSELTVYEIVRGMRSKRAAKQLAAFLQTVSTSDVFPISRAVLLKAADLWVEAHHGGHPKSDADLIIAATALEHGRALASGNTAHFAWISGLQLTNWRTL